MLTEHQEALVFFASGVYLMIHGLTAKYLINEYDFEATPEEREKAVATPRARIITVSIGAVACGFAVWRYLH